MHVRTLLSILGLAAAAALPAQAIPLVRYEVVTLGLRDADHTSSTGYQFSSAEFLTSAGLVFGQSSRYGAGGGSAWVYDSEGGTTTRIGLLDAAHTRSDGYQFSTTDHFDDLGFVGGYSSRYAGSTSLGLSAWVHDGTSGTTTRVGLFDADHTRSDGYQWSAFQSGGGNAPFLFLGGYAAGYAYRYGGGTQRGQSAWVYDAATLATTQVGLFDAAHTRSDGYRYSAVRQLAESGFAIGNSFRYNGSSDFGASAWLYDSATTTTTRLGFLDAVHTRSDGYQSSTASSVNDSGLATGFSYRYTAGSSLPKGTSAWLYDSADASTTRIGFFDADHTRSSGEQFSYATHLNDAGLVAGYSGRYSSTGDAGQSAWLYDSASATHTRIGFVDAEHTRSGGSQYSQASLLNETGLVTGYSYRHAGTLWLGRSAWLYDSVNDSTTRVGLLDAAHTRSDGWRESFTDFLTDSGFVGGYSSRYVGSTAMGRSAWIHDPTSDDTTRVGLFDTAHTRSDGYQESSVEFLEEAGLAAGHSYRYNGSTAVGQSAWIYDAATDSQYDIVLSTRSDGYAFTEISFVGEDGLVLGSFEEFHANDFDAGPRAFAWTAADGAWELGTLVRGGLGPTDWQYLANAIRADGLGRIAGSGTFKNGSDLAYLLIPTVPEPGTLVLLAFGLGGVARRARAQRPPLSACARGAAPRRCAPAPGAARA